MKSFLLGLLGGVAGFGLSWFLVILVEVIQDMQQEQREAQHVT